MKNGSAQLLWSMIIGLLAGWIFLSAGCNSNPYRHGEILYNAYCANCHMEDGSGLIGNIPPLAGADYLRQQPDQIPCIIRYGLADTILVNGKTYSQPMAGIPELSATDITNIINYINQAWGNDLGFYPPNRVQEALENCASDPSSTGQKQR